MEWSQLQKFTVVAREENMSRAAEFLETSQPYLSQCIKRLEEELGYALFVREGKRVRLNESGRIFLQTVVQVEEMMQNTRLRLEEMNSIAHPQVSLYVSTASTLLPELLLYLRERNPQIQYQIHQWKNDSETSGDDIQILAGGEINRDEVLLTEEIHLALPRGHRVLNKEEIRLEDLRGEEFISLNNSWQLGREIHREMNRRLFVPRSTMQVDNPNMMRELLKVHMGIAFVPSVSWHSFAGEDIVIRPVADFELGRQVYLRAGTGKYLTREQRECMQGIREFFASKHKKYQGEL